MKMFKKSIALLIVIVMIMAAIPAALAADCMPGNAVTVSLSLGKGYGIDGNITVNDPNGIISSISFTGPSGYDGDVVTSGSGYFAYYSKNDVSAIGNCTITARVTLKNDKSLVGKSATISFSGTTSQSKDGGFVDVGASASATVTMIQPLDYSELQKQIGIAEGLTKGDYTAESWATLADALSNAKNHLSSTSQSAVDKAAKDLANAIAALVAMDYSKLEEALQNGNELMLSDDVTKMWKDLFYAMANGSDLLGSGDQEAVDNAAEVIQQLIDALKEAMAGTEDGGDEPTEPSEPSEPQGEFCNIEIHKLWPILFFISLAINVALIAFIIIKKKKADEE